MLITRGRYVLVTPGNSDAPGVTVAASAQQEIYCWSGEAASKTGGKGVTVRNEKMISEQNAGY